MQQHGSHLGDAVDVEAATHIVDQAKVLVRLLDANDIHEASGVLKIGARLPVDLDQALHQDVLALLAGERILELVTEQNDEGHALTELVRSGGGPGRPNATELVEHPVLRRIEPLEVAL
eukprot:scaffold247548_cov33-Tisochrysis_lutea.AAC.1